MQWFCVALGEVQILYFYIVCLLNVFLAARVDILSVSEYSIAFKLPSQAEEGKLKNEIAKTVNFQRLFVQHLSLGWFLGGTCHLVVATSVLSNLIWSPLGWPSCGSQGPHKTICDDS